MSGDLEDLDDFESLEGMRERLSQSYIDAGKQAETEAKKIDWLKNRTPLKQSLSYLGKIIGDEYLHSINDEMTPDIMNSAMYTEKLLWAAERSAVINCQKFLSGFGSTSDAFFNYLCNLSDEGELPIASFDKWYRPMQSISLVFFNQADKLMQEGHVTGALDKVAEAFLAKGYHDYMLWHEIGGDDKLSEVSRAKAIKRHVETYELNDKIIAYWRLNISIEHSNELAAELLHSVFPGVAHRTLARYVSQAKKIPPAGTL